MPFDDSNDNNLEEEEEEEEEDGDDDGGGGDDDDLKWDLGDVAAGVANLDPGVGFALWAAHTLFKIWRRSPRTRKALILRQDPASSAAVHAACTAASALKAANAAAERAASEHVAELERVRADAATATAAAAEAAKKVIEERRAAIEARCEKERLAKEALQDELDKEFGHALWNTDVLLARRAELRDQLLPRANAAQWRFVVVRGPAGQGKSSFVRNILEELGYPDKTKLVAVSKQGAGTKDPMPYFLDRHRVVLFDTVGAAAAGCPAESAECLAADVLVLFMGNARAEQVHVDLLTMSWRLANSAGQRVVLLQPRADGLFDGDDRSATADGNWEAADAVLANGKGHLFKEMLEVFKDTREPHLRGRLARHGLEPCADAARLFKEADRAASWQEWVDAVEAAAPGWLSAACLFVPYNYEKPDRPVRRLPACHGRNQRLIERLRRDDAEALARERLALINNMTGAGMDVAARVQAAVAALVPQPQPYGWLGGAKAVFGHVVDTMASVAPPRWGSAAWDAMQRPQRAWRHRPA